jgi:hypothetical protein
MEIRPSLQCFCEFQPMAHVDEPHDTFPVFMPLSRSAQDSIGRLEGIHVFVQPGGEQGPLSQQRLMGDLDNDNILDTVLQSSVIPRQKASLN